MRQGTIGRQPGIVGHEHIVHAIGIERLGRGFDVAAQHGGLQAAAQPAGQLAAFGAKLQCDVGNLVLLRQFAIY